MYLDISNKVEYAFNNCFLKKYIEEKTFLDSQKRRSCLHKIKMDNYNVINFKDPVKQTLKRMTLK